MHNKLKQLRKQQGLTIRKLASLSGIRYATLCDIENGKQDARMSTLLAIAQALKYRIELIKSD